MPAKIRGPAFPWIAGLLLSAGCGGPAATAPPSAPPADATGYDLVYEKVVAGNQDLYVQPAGGGAERRLTDHPALDGLPRWTPDGRAVVFCSERTGHYQLFEVAAEGGEARPLRSNGATEYQADVSPDGRRLAFLSNIDGSESLWVMERGGGAARVLRRHGRNTVLGNPHWSPDGGRIVFSSNWRIGHQIYVLDVAGGEQRRISGLASGGCEPRFSPDGRRVVYVSRGHHRPTSRLAEHDLETGKERILVDWPALNYDPVYSPDGAEIAFASTIAGGYAVYRQRLSDGRAWRVTFGSAPARYPDYRPSRPR